MPYYRECPECRLNLDPGEICDCKKKAAADAGTPATAEVRPSKYTTIKISSVKENVKC